MIHTGPDAELPSGHTRTIVSKNQFIMIKSTAFVGWGARPSVGRSGELSSLPVILTAVLFSTLTTSRRPARGGPLQRLGLFVGAPTRDTKIWAVDDGSIAADMPVDTRLGSDPQVRIRHEALRADHHYGRAQGKLQLHADRRGNDGGDRCQVANEKNQKPLLEGTRMTGIGYGRRVVGVDANGKQWQRA